MIDDKLEAHQTNNLKVARLLSVRSLPLCCVHWQNILLHNDSPPRMCINASSRCVEEAGHLLSVNCDELASNPRRAQFL